MPKRKTAAQKKVQQHRSALPALPTTVYADQSPERITRHDRVLTLLSRRDGAKIHDMMESTGWQQHSVRGFAHDQVQRIASHGIVTRAVSRQEGRR